MNNGFERRRPALLSLCALTLAVLASFFIAGCAADRIVRVSDRAEVEFKDLVGAAKGYDLVFVGELHKTRWHHRVQLDVIRGLREAGAPLAIGLEMFGAAFQEDLDSWVAGEMDTEDFLDIYYENWHVPWRYYRDIFMYARDNKVPMVGLNVSRRIIHKVFTGGLKSLTPEESRGIPPVVCDVDREYEEFIRSALEEHDGEGESFKRFCEAQMVWDTAMADNAVRYIEANPGRVMAVLAGSGHSWRRGIPGQVSRMSGLKSVVILPELPHRLNIEDATVKDADYIWIDP